ncbi:MAG: alpha/beta hydrolase-fold protein [Candidatus Sulfopaludibacter sp.]|nr:alpha/beta hydrolase-fold protein [Candidatus Sulfopaludibacter sp.]
MFRLLGIAFAVCLMTGINPACAQAPARPTRDPHTPGYVTATELPDGANAPANTDGNFILGPTHSPAPEMTVHDDVPQGTVYNFDMQSTDSRIYPGIAREARTFGTPDPANPAKLNVTTSHPAPYTRHVAVYVPKQYVAGTVAPFIVGADGPDRALFTALDNLIAAHKVPVMIAISIGNGSGDAQGSERGLEYDTMSGLYAEFVEKEVLPLVEKQYNVKLTTDPNGRATMGGSSGGSCALIMAWYHPEWYHRVLTYSGTYVNQQWPWNPETPGGAWDFHQRLIPNSPVKPIRIWMEVGDKDNYNPNIMRDDMHDWVLANENMAKVLAAKGYHYQFVFARNAGHTDRAVKQQTLPEALEYLWAGYRPPRPSAPTRDPHTAGYVAAKELPDGANAPVKADGNFILGPTHSPAPEMTAQEGVPQGTVYDFTMESTGSKTYPGIAREANTNARTDPANPGRMVVNSHPAPYTRKVAVYVPKQYVPGTAAPFIVGADGPDRALFTALDNLIAAKKVPVMIAISIGNGSGDAQGSERGLEYDTMSGLYAEFVEKEVLPLVEKQYHVKLTKDPNGRATMGGSSGGSAALAMAWYHPELYHRVLTYSGTYVNQQWPANPETPHGAWEFHEHLIPNSPVKPIRIWMEVGDRDNLNTRDDYHDWVLANENMAKVLAAKHYHYQFVFARNAGHTDRAVKQQTLPEALEYIWQGYPVGGKKN